MIFETDISISIQPNPYLFASVLGEFHPNEASNEYNPIAGLILLKPNHFLTSYASSFLTIKKVSAHIEETIKCNPVLKSAHRW